MAGLVNRHTSHILPLKASSVFAEVNGFAARLLATLTYYNDCHYDIEGLFVFPQDEKTTIVEFDATIEERHVSTEIREKSSLGALKSAYAIEEREDELFSLSIGKIPPLSSVFIQVGLITELLADEISGGSIFILPSIFTPRLYEVNEDEKQQNNLYGSQMLISDLPRKTNELYSFDLQLEVVAPCLLAGCSSKTHAIQVDADCRATNASRVHITIAEPHTYDRELEILLHLAEPFDPCVIIEEGKKILIPSDSEHDSIPTRENISLHQQMLENFIEHPAVMVNFTPMLDSFKNYSSEFIFLVDRSGSMSGKHIFQVKEALILFLKSLPCNSYFNIVGFGSYYRCLFQESLEYNDENLNKAMNYANKMRADLGGTNLVLPLEFIFDQPTRQGSPRIIFLLTDGGVSNTLDVVDLVRRNSHACRFYTFGIGPEACPHLVQGVAGPTQGKSWFITDEERIPPKVMEALDSAMRPAVTDVELIWHLPEGYDVIQFPRKIPFIFDRERMVLYGILHRPPDKEKEVTKASHCKRMESFMRSFSNNSVKVFWFDDDMEYLPEEQLLMELNEDEIAENVFHGDTSTESLNQNSEMIGKNSEAFGQNSERPREIEALGRAGTYPASSTQNSNKITSPTGVEKDKREHFVSSVQSKRHRYAADHNFEKCEQDAHGTNEETAYPHVAERDSGLGFSMDDVDETAVRPGTKAPMNSLTSLPSFKIGDCFQIQTKVCKNSEILGTIGVPKNFAAVEVKGYVGGQEFDQIVPYPMNCSCGPTKRLHLHPLLARALIRDFSIADDITEESMRIMYKIARQNNIHCRLTAFTSVDQYCYEDEVLSALQYMKKEDAALENHRKVLVLDRTGGLTTGLGRRLSSPEGSDQESIEEFVQHSLRNGEEPTDLYRLDRSGTIDSSAESSPAKSLSNSTRQINNYAGRQGPPLSNRYVVGEKRVSSTQNVSNNPSTKDSSPIPPLPSKEYKPYVCLAKQQSKRGSWELSEEFANCIGIPLHDLQQASPLADNTVCAAMSEELEEIMKRHECQDGAQLWATALALSWLCRHHSENQNEWFLLARKADTWLKHSNYPEGFTFKDLKKLAYQALVLMHKAADPNSPQDKVGEFVWPVF